MKILNSSPSPFNFSSETASNMASKILAIVCCMREDNLCSNVYSGDDGTMVLEAVEQIKDIEAGKNKFMSVELP